MKIQQISRYRAKSGWQTTGVSKEVTQVMEKEFAGMYKLIFKVPSDIPFILDVGYGSEKNKNNFYISHIIQGYDAKGRPALFSTGFILDRQLLRYFTDQPEMFLRISNENFNHEYDAEQEKKKELPELESFQMDDLLLDVTAIRHKYAITDEEFEQLIYRIYEVFLDDSRKTMEFGFDGPKEEYVNLIREMVFLAYSVTPPSLRNRITFSNYQITGMINRMFTVIEADSCGQNTNIWFNLKTREFSELSGDKDEISLRTNHLSYLAYCTEEEREEFLKKIDDNLKSLYKNPSVKPGETLQTALVVAFLSKNEIWNKCVNPSILGKYMSKLAYMKADNTNLIEIELAGLLDYAEKNSVKVSDTHFKGCQNYYFSTQMPDYEEVFLNVVSTREPSTLRKLLRDAMKEESSKKVDDFIATLIIELGKHEDVWTQDIVSLLQERYLKTKSNNLKDCYYEYIGQMDLTSLPKNDLKKTIEKSISQVSESRDREKQEIASGVLRSQVRNLDRNQIELSQDTINKLLKLCVNSEQEYENALFESVKQYYKKMYLSKDLEEATQYYKNLRDNNSQMGSEVEQELYQTTEDRILDHFYVKYQMPKQIQDFQDFSNKLDYIMEFKVYQESLEALLKQYISSLDRRMSQNKNNNSSLYEMYQKLRDELDQVEKMIGVNPVRRYRDDIEQYFWKYADIEGMSKEEFKSYKRKISGGNNQKKQNIEKYWDIVDDFDFIVKSQQSPDENIIRALITDEYIRSPEIRERHLRNVIRGRRNAELDLDVLLMKYFVQREGCLSNTGFLEELTEEQEEQIEESIMLSMYDEDGRMQKAIKKGIKRQRKNNKPAKSPLKIILPILGLAVVLTVSVIVAKVFIFKGDKDDSEAKKMEENTGIKKEKKSGEDKKNLEADPLEAKVYNYWLSLNPKDLDDRVDGEIEIPETQKIGDVGFCIKDGKIYTVHEEKLDKEPIADMGKYSNLLTDNENRIVYCIYEPDGSDKEIYSYPYKEAENELDKHNKKTYSYKEDENDLDEGNNDKTSEKESEISSFCLDGEDIIVLIKGENNAGEIIRVNLQGEKPTIKERKNLNDLLPEDAIKIKDIVNYEDNLYGILDEEKSAKKILSLEKEDSSAGDNNNAEEIGEEQDNIPGGNSEDSSSSGGIISEDYRDPNGTDPTPTGQ